MAQHDKHNRWRTGSAWARLVNANELAYRVGRAQISASTKQLNKDGTGGAQGSTAEGYLGDGKGSASICVPCECCGNKIDSYEEAVSGTCWVAAGGVNYEKGRHIIRLDNLIVLRMQADLKTV